MSISWWRRRTSNSWRPSRANSEKWNTFKLRFAKSFFGLFLSENMFSHILHLLCRNTVSSKLDPTTPPRSLWNGIRSSVTAKPVSRDGSGLKSPRVRSPASSFPSTWRRSLGQEKQQLQLQLPRSSKLSGGVTAATISSCSWSRKTLERSRCRYFSFNFCIA